MTAASETHLPLALLDAQLGEELGGLGRRDLLRHPVTLEAVDGARVRIRGRWVTSWAGNDYLGFSTHPRLLRAAAKAAERWGVGARASRLLAGTTQLHEELERALAAFFGAEAACVFPSGYLANLGCLQALADVGDVVVADRLVHASLVDACRLSRATFRVFRHNDPAHLGQLLARYRRARRRVVVTEGVFSMEGHAAPLGALLAVTRTHGAVLYLDDAHGAFILGARGRGTPEQEGLPHGAMIYMGTLGKALGCQGAFLVGSGALVRMLQNRARPFLYTTALAPPLVAAALEGLRLIEAGGSTRERLAANRTQGGHVLFSSRARDLRHHIGMWRGFA